MEQEKIGRFIAICRKEKKLTQEQLAEKLNITSKAVSKWENGKGLPDVSIMQKLCEILNITLNELFNGEKIKEENYKKIADKNLLYALEHSSDNVGEKIKYYKKEWEKEHILLFVIEIIIWIFIVLILKYKNYNDLIGLISGFAIGFINGMNNNAKMKYVEDKIYIKILK